MFLAASYIYLTFDGEFEGRSLHHLYNLHSKPRDAGHRLHSHPASMETRLEYADTVGDCFRGQMSRFKFPLQQLLTFWFFPPSITVRGSTTLPKDLLIFEPFSSNTNPCVITLEYGAFPVSKKSDRFMSCI